MNHHHLSCSCSCPSQQALTDASISSMIPMVMCAETSETPLRPVASHVDLGCDRAAPGGHLTCPPTLGPKPSRSGAVAPAGSGWSDSVKDLCVSASGIQRGCKLSVVVGAEGDGPRAEAVNGGHSIDSLLSIASVLDLSDRTFSCAPCSPPWLRARRDHRHPLIQVRHTQAQKRAYSRRTGSEEHGLARPRFLSRTSAPTAHQHHKRRCRGGERPEHGALGPIALAWPGVRKRRDWGVASSDTAAVTPAHAQTQVSAAPHEPPSVEKGTGRGGEGTA